MSTIGIVVLALLCGLFLAILIGAVIFLIWTCWKLNQAVQLAQSDLTSKIDLLTKGVTSFESNLQQVLQVHALAFDQAVQKINGEGLASASKLIVLSANRIERACIAFGELAKCVLADRDTLSKNGAGLEPDEYATPEPGEKFVSFNPTAQGDFQSQTEEQE